MVYIDGIYYLPLAQYFTVDRIISTLVRFLFEPLGPDLLFT